MCAKKKPKLKKKRNPGFVMIPWTRTELMKESNLTLDLLSFLFCIFSINFPCTKLIITTGSQLNSLIHRIINYTNRNVYTYSTPR